MALGWTWKASIRIGLWTNDSLRWRSGQAKRGEKRGLKRFVFHSHDERQHPWILYIWRSQGNDWLNCFQGDLSIPNTYQVT